MLDIYTPKHFDSHVSVQLPIVDSLCFGMTSLNHLLLLQVLTDFTEFGDLIAVRYYVVDAKFCENLNWFDRVIKMSLLSPGHSVYNCNKTVHVQGREDIVNDGIVFSGVVNIDFCTCMVT